MLLPRNNNYTWALPAYFRDFGYGNNRDNLLNLIGGAYQHSDNLHNRALNLAAASSSNLSYILRMHKPSSTAQLKMMALPPDLKRLLRSSGRVISCQDRLEAADNTEEWISLPILEPILAFAFSVVTVFQLPTRNVRPWRANSLVVLLAKMNKATRQQSLLTVSCISYLFVIVARLDRTDLCN